MSICPPEFCFHRFKNPRHMCDQVDVLASYSRHNRNPGNVRVMNSCLHPRNSYPKKVPSHQVLLYLCVWLKITMDSSKMIKISLFFCFSLLNHKYTHTQAHTHTHTYAHTHTHITFKQEKSQLPKLFPINFPMLHPIT